MTNRPVSISDMTLLKLTYLSLHTDNALI